ncbi:MAG: Ni/Fe-hydrogenase cytochrome b subunit [Deferribacteraceae bacterium]|jgi:Ni/Fe-hydrogenase subunit HybB-like protein|nr:Ni/Fe-hydrogenase cytochrome b subunit [Deferribacteraceae bacterium]
MMSNTNESAVLKAPILTKTFLITLIVVLIGVALIGYRYVSGIGVVSNLSDGYPWGIWLGYDVAVGTAFACGGYILAITVYIMNNFKYHPLIRSAVLASMFGYALAGLSVMVDIGRYWNSYNFFVPGRWQPNSVMFEVALCVMAYTVILIIEFLPAVFEGLADKGHAWAKSAYKSLDKVLIFIIALGVLLPTMHQSSLGSMLIISGYKLHPLWQTMFLPMLFLGNAILMGFAIVGFEVTLATVGFKRPFEKELVSLSKVIPFIAVGWVVIRFISITTSGAWGEAFTPSWLTLVFWLEIILVLIPAFIIQFSSWSGSMRGIFVSCFMLMFGGGMYRLSVYITAFDPGSGYNTYFPSVSELFITLSMIAIEILGYITLVKIFPVLANPAAHKKH